MKNNILSILYNGIYRICHGAGTGVLTVAALIAVGASYVLAGCRYAASAVLELVGMLYERMFNGRGRSQGSFSLARFLSQTATSMGKAIAGTGRTFRKDGFRPGLRRAGGDVVRFFKALWKTLAPVLNVAVPVAAVVVCVLVIRDKNDFTYGISVTFKGEALGVVRDESDFDRAVASIGNRVASATGEIYHLDVDPTFELVTVPATQAFASVSDIEQGIIQHFPELFRESAGLYVNGELVAVTDHPEAVEGLMQAMLDEAAKEYEEFDLENASEVSVDFVDDVELSMGLYPVTAKKTVAEIDELLHSLVNEEETYTVVSGDSPKRIASKFDLSLSELYAMNPGMEDATIYPGDEVVVSSETAYLPICLSCVMTYDQETEIPVIYIDSDEYYLGVTKTKTEGAAGIDRITAKVTYVNGVETARLIQDTVSIKEAVASEVYKGTQRGFSLASIKGFYIRPVDGGHISSDFGTRINPFDHKTINSHSGQDIAVPKNTPIHAARSGTITFMGVSGSYGNLVTIDHGDGYVTYYAHCNGFASGVKVGDYVEVGETIAYVGMTGRATGYHVHFELRYKNQAVNTNGLFPK